MAPVIQASSARLGTDRIVYDVYRDVASVDNLRYDITFLYPEKLGNELPKTYGHYHKNEMMEIMEVVSGQAWWLLQRYDKDPKIIKEAYLIKADENEKAIFPPGFGVISINPEKENALVLSNWLSLKMESDYAPYEQLRGACYYVLEKENGEIVFEKNSNYQEVPELIKLKPKEIPELEITFDKPLYSYIKTPEKLDFLNNPQKYKNILTIENCYSPRLAG
jgi:oxalate decarboxylase/phosphoglucose isomerase-like protein (cupin superfamily)